MIVPGNLNVEEACVFHCGLFSSNQNLNKNISLKLLSAFSLANTQTPCDEKKSIKQKAQRIRIRDTWSQHNVIRSNFQIVDKNLPGKIETFDYYTR